MGFLDSGDFGEIPFIGGLFGNEGQDQLQKLLQQYSDEWKARSPMHVDNQRRIMEGVLAQYQPVQQGLMQLYDGQMPAFQKPDISGVGVAMNDPFAVPPQAAGPQPQPKPYISQPATIRGIDGFSPTYPAPANNERGRGLPGFSGGPPAQATNPRGR